MSLISLQADILTEGTYRFMEESVTKPTLLLVDDEVPVREFIQMLLEGEGYQILTADDGKTALDVYDKFQSEIELVISDMNMPHIDGEQLFFELKNRNPALKFIAISGYIQQDKIDQLNLNESVKIITKPFSIDVLLKQVATSLAT